MKKANEPVDYLDAIRQMRQEEQDERNQIHSPGFIPQEKSVVDYAAVSKAWDKTMRGMFIVNMPTQKGKPN